MTTEGPTFGQTISKARKAKSLSQKDLAGIILKEEDGTAISPQYLNDIEHDRRSPTSDHLIRQFAKALDLQEDLLFVLAGKIPDDVRKRVRNTEQAAMAFMSFRTSITKK
jgi:transcriptional regulator with XRE-family HTH domain